MLLCRLIHALLIHQPNRNKDKGFDNIERAPPHQSNSTKVSRESLIPSDFKKPPNPSSGPQDQFTHEESGCIEPSIIGEVEHISIQSEQNLRPSPRKKLRRPARKQQTEKKTYGNRKPLEHQQPVTKIRMPRRLPVDELELVPDGVPLNPIHNSDGKSASIPYTSCIGSEPPATLPQHHSQK
jgi:hypothetical protein